VAAQEDVKIIISHDDTDASNFRLERPGGRSVEGWRVVNVDRFPVIYVGDRQLPTVPVSTEPRDDGTVVTVRVQVDSL